MEKRLKYFAKFLPVEGEIKEGDVYLSKWRKENKIYWFVHVTSMDDKYYYWDKQPYNKSDAITKVQLFLCSRDIQVGDKYYPHQLWFEKDMNNPLVWNDNHVMTEHCFRVIGEISPDAIWVKEGDEFDEEQLRICWDRGFVPINYWFPEAIKKKGLIYAIKCPTCKNFH